MDDIRPGDLVKFTGGDYSEKQGVVIGRMVDQPESLAIAVGPIYRVRPIHITKIPGYPIELSHRDIPGFGAKGPEKTVVAVGDYVRAVRIRDRRLTVGKIVEFSSSLGFAIVHEGTSDVVLWAHPDDFGFEVIPEPDSSPVTPPPVPPAVAHRLDREPPSSEDQCRRCVSGDREASATKAFAPLSTWNYGTPPTVEEFVREKVWGQTATPTEAIKAVEAGLVAIVLVTDTFSGSPEAWICRDLKSLDTIFVRDGSKSIIVATREKVDAIDPKEIEPYTENPF
jgi:hypothetical protein